MSGKNRRSFKQTLELLASREIKSVHLTRRQQRELATSVISALNPSKIPTKNNPFEMEAQELRTKLDITRAQLNEMTTAYNRAMSALRRAKREIDEVAE